MRWKAIIIIAVLVMVWPGMGLARNQKGKDKVPQVFRAVYPAAPKSLDPHVAADANAWPVIMAVYDRLVILEAGTARPAPALIKTLRISPDGRRYTFVLDENHTFSDGVKVDSQAALFTFDRLMTSEVGKRYYPYLKQFEPVGPYTFTLILDRPWPPFLASLALPQASLISPGLKDRPIGYLNTRSLGSGRYQVYDWTNNTIGLKARPDMVSRPKLDFAMFHYEPDAAARYKKTIEHEAHLAVEPDLSQGVLPAHYRMVAVPTFSVRYLAFNTRRAYTKSQSARRALSYVLGDGFSGQPGRLNGPFPPGLFYNSPADVVKPAGDLAAQGRAILRDLGPPPNGRLILAYKQGDKDGPAEAARIAELLASCGLAVETKVLAGEDGQKVFEAGDYDLFLDTRTPEIPAPDMWLGRFLDSASTAEGNPAFFASAGADRLIDEIVTTTGRPNDGPADIRMLEIQRAAKLAELAEIAEIEAPYLFLYQVQRPLIIDLRLANALPHPQWPEVWPLDLIDLKPFSHKSGVNPTGKTPEPRPAPESRPGLKTQTPVVRPEAPAAPESPKAAPAMPTINLPGGLKSGAAEAGAPPEPPQFSGGPNVSAGNGLDSPLTAETPAEPLLEFLTPEDLNAQPGGPNPSPAPDDFIGVEME